jgi:hypothetical protein
MIGKYGGAIWDSVQQIFLPPLTKQAIKPLMHMDPISGAFAMLIDPFAGYMHLLPTINKLTQPPQVPSVGKVNRVEYVATYITVPLLSPRAPHGQIKRTTPTIKWQKPFKRLQVPLKKRRYHTTLTSPHLGTINPLLIRHLSIARKIGKH